MPNIQAVTGKIQSIIPNNANIKSILQETNGTWVGIHDLKTEFRKLCLEGADNLISTLSNRLKSLHCKILTIPKTEKGILPAMPKDPFAVRSFYLVKNSYPECNIANYVHLHDSSNASLSAEDLKTILTQLSNPKWTRGDDIIYYQNALREREKILNSYLASGYKWNPETQSKIRSVWEKKMLGSSKIKPRSETVTSPKIQQTKPTENLSSASAKTVQKTTLPAKTVLLLAIPKEVSDVCQKIPQKSSFRKYANKLRDLRYNFKNEKLEYIGNNNKITLYLSSENGSKEIVFDGKMAFPKDVKQLVQNLENILKSRREKTLTPFLQYRSRLEYKPQTGSFQPFATLGLTPQEVKIALDVYNTRMLNKVLPKENEKLIVFNPKTLLSPQGLTSKEIQSIIDIPNFQALNKFKKIACPETKLLEYTPEPQTTKAKTQNSLLESIKLFFKKLC